MTFGVHRERLLKSGEGFTVGGRSTPPNGSIPFKRRKILSTITAVCHTKAGLKRPKKTSYSINTIRKSWYNCTYESKQTLKPVIFCQNVLVGSYRNLLVFDLKTPYILIPNLKTVYVVRIQIEMIYYNLLNSFTYIV